MSTGLLRILEGGLSAAWSPCCSKIVFLLISLAGIAQSIASSGVRTFQFLVSGAAREDGVVQVGSTNEL